MYVMLIPVYNTVICRVKQPRGSTPAGCRMTLQGIFRLLSVRWTVDRDTEKSSARSLPKGRTGPFPVPKTGLSRAAHGQSCVHSALISTRGSTESAESVPKPPLRIAGRRFDWGRIKRQLEAPGGRRNDRAGNRP